MVQIVCAISRAGSSQLFFISWGARHSKSTVPGLPHTHVQKQACVDGLDTLSHSCEQNSNQVVHSKVYIGLHNTELDWETIRNHEFTKDSKAKDSNTIA